MAKPKKELNFLPILGIFILDSIFFNLLMFSKGTFPIVSQKNEDII